MEQRRTLERAPLTEMQRILVRGNLFKKKDKLVEESAKYLSADAVAVKIVVSLILGAWFLFLRVLSFGYPPMTDKMLADTSLTIAGIIMYLPLYTLGILVPLIAWALIKKIKAQIKIRRIDQMLDECRPCWN